MKVRNSLKSLRGRDRDKPSGPPQGPGLRDQQGQAPLQGAPGLIPGPSALAKILRFTGL